MLDQDPLSTKLLIAQKLYAYLASASAAKTELSDRTMLALLDQMSGEAFALERQLRLAQEALAACVPPRPVMVITGTYRPVPANDTSGRAAQ